MEGSFGRVSDCLWLDTQELQIPVKVTMCKVSRLERQFATLYLFHAPTVRTKMIASKLRRIQPSHGLENLLEVFVSIF